MAGKSFKGNLEVLNLSDIFQSLAMNRHSGTLIVTDGKREKKIFFAEGEITLLSSSRRQRLGELLVAEGRVSEDELELALKLQKQSRKRLGEILVEEGFCTEDDIDRLVRMQIEEEIYDLFLWKRAEFEFIADQMPEDMARESPNLTRLAFNTNSLIMEALRRLDEWSLIRNLVPTTKEVFVLIDVDSLHAAQIPERMRDDARRMIDARTTVEGLAERFLVSEFEMCKHLAEMVQAGAVRPLTQEELAEKAEEAYALNDFSAAASLYGRLAEYFPDAPKILIPLADSLRRTGAEKQALVIYEQLAKQLESHGDQDRLRRCYEAITQLDPSRVDLARKLEEMDYKQLTSSGRKVGVLHVLALLLIVGGGGLGLAWVKRHYGVVDDERARSEAAKQLLKEHDEAKFESQQSKSEEDYRRWFEKGRELWTRYATSPEARRVELPLLVSSTPAGFKVYAGTPGNMRLKGVTKPEEPFLECTFEPSPRILVELRRLDGEGEALWSQSFETKEWLGVVKPVVTERPTRSCQDDFRLDARVVWSEALGAWLVPSRRGVLRALRPADLGSLSPWDGLILGEQGDVFGDPLVVPVGGGERLLVGGVEGGVLSIDLGSSGPGSDPVQRRYPTEGPVAAAPLFVPPSAIDAGRVVVVSTTGEVKAYTLEGGAPVWSASAEAGIRFAPLPLKGNGCLVAGDDAMVVAYEAADGKVRWSWEAPALLATAPQAVGPDRVLLTLEGGRLLLLSAEGRALASWQAPGKQVVACADAEGERVFATAGDGQLFALQGQDLKPAWGGRSIGIPVVPSPHLGVRGPRLLVASGYGASTAEPSEKDPAIQAFDCANGRLVWQGSFYPALAGRVLRLTITGQGSFVSTSVRSLHHFADEGY